MVWATITAGVLIYGAIHNFGTVGWLGGLVLGVILMATQTLVHIWSNHARMKEVDRFANLPKWAFKSD
ncbi:hypothetical protein BH09PSE3_BH09PSE3_16300 [soil metagenome]